LFKHWIEFDPNTADQFENEIEILRTMRHPNIVLFFGARKTDEGIPFLVTEFVPRGSLTTLLRESVRNKETFSWRQKIAFMLDAANGMLFLHNGSPPKLHRDFKPQNLLVTAQLRVKIADFGTAKLVSAHRKWERMHEDDVDETLFTNSFSSGTESQIGTLPYMAPELHGHDKIIHEKELDIYSFGMTMWVVAMGTGEDPFSERSIQIRNVVPAGGRPEYPSNEWRPKWISLMTRCWAADPADRPSFEQISDELCHMGLAEELFIVI